MDDDDCRSSAWLAGFIAGDVPFDRHQVIACIAGGACRRKAEEIACSLFFSPLQTNFEGVGFPEQSFQAWASAEASLAGARLSEAAKVLTVSGATPGDSTARAGAAQAITASAINRSKWGFVSIIARIPAL